MSSIVFPVNHILLWQVVDPLKINAWITLEKGVGLNFTKIEIKTTFFLVQLAI